MPTAIEFRDVSLKTAEGRTLLDHVNLSLEEGTTTAVLGRSGSGKTTLLNTIAGLIKPSAGAIRLNGANIGGRAAERVVRSGLSLVPEGRQIIAPLSVQMATCPDDIR